MTSDTLTLVSEGERRVVGIALPKNPDSPSRKVTLENNLYGWTFVDQLGDIKAGDLVVYKIEKNEKNFYKLSHIAPVDHNQRDQTPEPVPGRDDAPGGGGSADNRLANTVPAEREVPNTDIARFEGWGFVGPCGMVDLATEELSDALEAGELDSISGELLKSVATHLLNAADQAQRALVGRVDRGAQSNTRARGLVRTALRRHPVRAGLSDLDAWGAELTKTTVRLLQLAATL